MEEFKEITEDRGLYKKTLRDGIEMLPDSNSKIIVNFKINLEDGTFIEEKFNENFDFEDPNKLLGLKIGIRTMKKGEKAIFVMRYDYGLGEITKNNIKSYSSVIACVDLIDIN